MLAMLEGMYGIMGGGGGGGGGSSSKVSGSSRGTGYAGGADDGRIVHVRIGTLVEDA